MDRLQLIKDRKEVVKFIYSRGQNYAINILNNDDIINIINMIMDECNNYKDNLYGKPTCLDIMCEAFRHVNYSMNNISSSDGVVSGFVYDEIMNE